MITALIRAELLQALRTRETWSFFLLPCLLLTPSIFLITIFVFSLDTQPALVAVPADTPESLPILEALEREDLRGLSSTDPAADLAAGAVDAAILYWREGEGIQSTVEELEMAVHWRWEAPIVGDPELMKPVEEAIKWAGNRALEQDVLRAGGILDRDLWFAHVRKLPAEDNGSSTASDSTPIPMTLGYLTAMAGFLSVFLIAMTTQSERKNGIAETFAVTATPTWYPLLARLLVPTALEILGCWLLAGSCFMLVVDWFPGPEKMILYTIQVSVALLFVNTFYLVLGLLTKDAKSAYNIGGMLMLCSLGLSAAGLADVPAWVPAAGVLGADTVWEIAVGSGVTLLCVGLIIAVAARFVGWAATRGVS